MKKSTYITLSAIVAAAGIFFVFALFSNSAMAQTVGYYPYNIAVTNCRAFPNRCNNATLTTVQHASTYAQPSTPTPVTPPVVVTPAPVTVTNNNTNNNYVTGGGSSYPVYVDRTVYTPSYSYPSYNYPVYSTPVYSYPVYQTYAPSLSVTCSANTTYTAVGEEVHWRAYVSGGYGYYSYSWIGTEGLWGNTQDIFKSYSYPGSKDASVTVTSGGYSATAYCAPITIQPPYGYVAQPIIVPTPIYNQPIQQPIQNSGLDIACYASDTKIKVGQAVTWTAEVAGAQGPFRFSWSGTNSLAGSQSVITKYYNTVGSKRATVTVIDGSGRSTTRTCGATITVVSKTSVAHVTVVKETPPVEVTESPLVNAASPFFSFVNVPWGWVAFLVIMVLLIAIFYLLFNRLKI